MPVRDDAKDMSRDRWRRQLPEKSQIVGGLRCQSRARADTGAEPSIAATEGVYDVSLSILEWVPAIPSAHAGRHFNRCVLNAFERLLYCKYHQGPRKPRIRRSTERRHCTDSSKEHRVDLKGVLTWWPASPTLTGAGVARAERHETQDCEPYSRPDADTAVSPITNSSTDPNRDRTLRRRFRCCHRGAKTVSTRTADVSRWLIADTAVPARSETRAGDSPEGIQPRAADEAGPSQPRRQHGRQ